MFARGLPGSMQLTRIKFLSKTAFDTHTNVQNSDGIKPSIATRLRTPAQNPISKTAPVY